MKLSNKSKEVLRAILKKIPKLEKSDGFYDSGHDMRRDFAIDSVIRRTRRIIYKAIKDGEV